MVIVITLALLAAIVLPLYGMARTTSQPMTATQEAEAAFEAEYYKRRHP